MEPQSQPKNKGGRPPKPSAPETASDCRRLIALEAVKNTPNPSCVRALQTLLESFERQESQERQEREEAQAHQAEQENSELLHLRAQAEQDLRQIERLEAACASLRASQQPVITKIVPDPAHSEQVARLGAQVAFLLKHTGTPETVALDAVRTLDTDSASTICEMVGLHWKDVARFRLLYPHFGAWTQVIEQASVNDSPLIRLCKAAMLVETGSEKRGRKSVDPVTAAKYLTGTLREPEGLDYI
jgi:hypothetical protein